MSLFAFNILHHLPFGNEDTLLRHLKNELVERRAGAMRQEAREAMFDWIAVLYDCQRRHSALEYRSPAEFEQTVLATDAA